MSSIMNNLASIHALHPEHSTEKKKPFNLFEHLKALNKFSIVKLRVNKTSTGKYSFYLETNKNGKRDRDYLGIYYSDPYKKPRGKDKEVLKQAELLQKNRVIKIIEEGQSIRANKKARDILFLDYFKYSLNKTREKNNGRYDKCWNHTLLHLERFLEQNPGLRNRTLKLIDKDYVIKFRNYLLNNLSTNSARTYFSKFKSALYRAVQEQLIPTSPAVHKDLTIKRVETKREHLLLEEIQILSQTPCISEQTKRAFLFACFTGLRLSDLRKLTWDEIQNGEIHYRQKKTGSYEELKLNKTALKILELQRNDNGTVSPDGKVFKLISKQNSRKHISKWVMAAGINKKIFWHSARHTFAVLSLSAGNDIYTTSKLLGHKSVKVTEIYAKLINKKKQEAIDKMPTVEL